MRRIYLAARYSKNPEMRGVRDVLQGLGYQVTSRWIDCHTDVVGDFTSSFTPEFLNERPDLCGPLGQHDLDDLSAADCVISFTYPAGQDGGKGGRHVEFGYGLALSKRMILVGPRQHVFHTLPQVEHFTDWPRFVMSIATNVIDPGGKSYAEAADDMFRGGVRS